MPTLTTYDGLRVAVSCYGSDDAPVTLLLAHCWTSDQDLWRYQVRDVLAEHADRVRVVAWDHRGHGLSDPVPRSATTIANLARDMSDVVDVFAPRGTLVLAGHSIGGMTIMALAEQRPALFAERVVGVMLCSTSSGGLESVTLGLPEMGQRLKGAIPRMLELRSRTLSKRARRRMPYLERQVMSRLVFGSPQRMRDVTLAVEGLINCPADSVAGFYADSMRHERTAALAALAGIPTEVLVGTDDRLTPARMSRRIADAVPGAGLTVIPEAGHMLPLERDDLVSATLLRMLRPVVDQPRHRA